MKIELDVSELEFILNMLEELMKVDFDYDFLAQSEVDKLKELSKKLNREIYPNANL